MAYLHADSPRRSGLPDDAGALLDAMADASPWYDGAGGLRIVDYLDVADLSAPLWLLLARDGGARLYFFAVTPDGPLTIKDATATPLYQRELLAWLAARGAVPAAQGGQIVFRGPSPAALAGGRMVDSGHGESSNQVCRLDAGGLALMHKVYRRPATDNHEAQACLQLGRLISSLPSASPLVPRHVADYLYVDGEGREYPLGLLSEYVDGQGLHADLSVSLRTLWPLAQSPDGGCAALVARHCAALLPELAGWREFLRQGHQAMTQAFAATPACAAPPFALAAYCADARARLARLRPLVDADPLLSEAHAHQVHALFDRLEQQHFRATDGTLPASACHGDLHLSHLLWRRAEDGPEGQGQALRKLIDMSPPAVNMADPAFRNGSALLDWVALERALDYVCLDEAALALTPHAGLSQNQTMHRMLLTRLDDMHADAADEAGARLLAACAHWHGAVTRALCGTGAADADRSRFYYGRLLQELEYNYGHRRSYYRCIDLFCLKKRLSQGV